MSPPDPAGAALCTHAQKPSVKAAGVQGGEVTSPGSWLATPGRSENTLCVPSPRVVPPGPGHSGYPWLLHSAWRTGGGLLPTSPVPTIYRSEAGLRDSMKEENENLPESSLSLSELMLSSLLGLLSAEIRGMYHHAQIFF